MYGLDRWSSDMLPYIPIEKWAKSSQWVVLSRMLGTIVDQDDLIIELFAKYCLPGRRCVGDVRHLSSRAACEIVTLIRMECNHELQSMPLQSRKRWGPRGANIVHFACMGMPLMRGGILCGKCCLQIKGLLAGALHPKCHCVQWCWQSDQLLWKPHLHHLGRR